MAHDYLTTADVLGMHMVLMKSYGGAPGVRDPGALEAALFRPQTGYYEDVVAEAAALMESLAINHPFVDGNKRIGHAAMETTLVLNGVEMIATIDAAEAVVLAVASGELDREAFSRWVADNQQTTEPF